MDPFLEIKLSKITVAYFKGAVCPLKTTAPSNMNGACLFKPVVFNPYYNKLQNYL